MTDNRDEIHVSTTEARGGTTQHKVRYVLGFGLVLVLVAFAIILTWA